MARKHHRVGPGIWTQPWSDEARLLALYLLTCEHRTMEGLYRLPLAYASEDTGWPLERVKAALDELERDGFCAYHAPSKVVLIRNAVDWQKPNGNQRIAAVRQAGEVPASPLDAEFIERCEKASPELAESLREAFPKRFGTLPEGRHEGFANASTHARGAGAGAGGSSSRSSPSTSSSPPKSKAAAPPFDADAWITEHGDDGEQAARLCLLLANLMRGNDPAAKVAPRSKAWLDPMRLLLTRDERTSADVERVIRWCQADEFWRSNVLSPGKLREQFGKLLLRCDPPPSAKGFIDRMSSREHAAQVNAAAARRERAAEEQPW